MRAFLVWIVITSALWALDMLAFGGYYSQAAWQEAKIQAQTLNHEIWYLIRKTGLWH
jgi:hypothetical protein